LKIFVCEYITGGGLYREVLPDGLLKEGLLMRDALLTELVELEDVELSCSCDVRVLAPSIGHVAMMDYGQDIWQVWHRLIQAADAVMVVAPETSGILLRLSQMVIEQGKLLLGCPPSVIALTSSKHATYHAMKCAGINSVPTYSAQEWLMTEMHAEEAYWVIKPDDGVGCEGVIALNDREEIIDWLSQQGREARHIVQPLRVGHAASLSMLCRHGQAWLLSCNRQKVAMVSGGFRYHGGIVNGFLPYWTAFDELAQRIASALPDLHGYVGVDLIFSEGKCPTLEVLEINPRITSSYPGLSQATGLNIAAELLRLMQNNALYRLPEITRNKIEITL
jgi:tyramine---L-glutamate ligase